MSGDLMRGGLLLWQERGGDLRGSRTAENVPLEHALWIFAGGRSTGKRSTRTRGGDTYFGIFPGGQGSTGSRNRCRSAQRCQPRHLPGW